MTFDLLSHLKLVVELKNLVDSIDQNSNLKNGEELKKLKKTKNSKNFDVQDDHGVIEGSNEETNALKFWTQKVEKIIQNSSNS